MGVEAVLKAEHQLGRLAAFTAPDDVTEVVESFDVELLRRHHQAARAWVDLIASLAGPTRLWDTGFQLGDWLDPAAPPDDPAASATDPYLVATAYFAWSARHVSMAARTLGDLTEAEDTPYGRARISWHFAGDEMRAEMVVPPNCTAMARLPAVRAGSRNASSDGAPSSGS